MTTTKDPNEAVTISVTVTVPGRLRGLLEAAANAIDVTSGSVPTQEAILLALIERGARSIVARVETPDQRRLVDITIADLADAFGITDTDAARKAAKQEREAREATAQAALDTLKTVEGLRSSVVVGINTSDGVEKFAAVMRHNIEVHNLRAVAVVGYVDASGAHVAAESLN